MIDEGYDVRQVCLNGHQITEFAATMPQFSKPFCPKCGERTITQCPDCKAPILGNYHTPGILSARTSPVPNNCHACGTAYPWRQQALAAAVEVLQMEFEGQDAADVVALVPVLAIEGPRTEVAALKFKRLVSNLSKPAYDITIKVVSDIASETAKKALGLKP
jgi:hypothetical protein